MPHRGALDDRLDVVRIGFLSPFASLIILVMISGPAPRSSSRDGASTTEDTKSAGPWARALAICLAVRSTVRHEEMSSGVEKQVAACPMRICIQSAAANGKAF